MMPSEEKAPGNIAWWDENDDDVGQAVRATVDLIKRDQDLFRIANLAHMRMYRNLAMVGLGPHTGFAVAPGLGAPLSLNVVRNMCNAAQSKIAKNRPKPWFQTSGANVTTQRKAEKAEQYIKGGFYQQNVYQKTSRCFLDACILGTGVAKVMPGKKQCLVERAFTPEVIVDNVEGMHGEPRNIYQYKYMDRGKLKADYPDKSAQIGEIPSIDYNYTDEEINEVYDRYAADLVRVEEGYHVASEEGADDGVYVKTVNGIALERVVWRHDWHPFEAVRWSTSPLGFWGMGLAEELRGIQLEINHIVRGIQTSFKLLSNPYVLVDRASNTSRGQITDVPGSILLYTGKPPSVYAPSVVAPEVFMHLKWLYEQAYAIAGISQITAQSAKPTGFTSGRAQLVHSDIESERFATVTRDWEDFHMRIAKKMLKVSEGVRGIKVKSFGGTSYNEVDFHKDLDITEDDYVLQAMPTSILGDSPEANIEMAERLTKAGLISEPSEVLKQIERPDMKALVSRLTAPRTLVENMVEDMLHGGPQQVPVEETDLSLTVTVATQMYVEAKLNKMDEAALSKVRNFIKTAVRMQKSTGALAGAAQPQMGAPPMPGAPPGAVPMPPNGFTPGAAGPVPLPPNGFTPGAPIQ
jgi:hypothetical protein